MLIDNLYLDANIGSYHWNRNNVAKHNLQEINPGIGIEKDFGLLRGMLGYYKNSIGRHSNYAILGYTPLIYDSFIGEFKLGGLAGVLSGYNIPIAPAIGFLGTYQKNNFGINLIATPSVTFGDDEAYGFAGLQARYKFK